MATLDPGIILQGRAPNVLGAMAQGMQLRAARDEMARGNALAQLYQQHGAGLLQGEGNALAALAAIDPAQAMDLSSAHLGQQATRQGMAHADERLGMDRETMRMRLEEVARSHRREELEAEAAQTQRQMEAGLLAWEQGPEAFETLGLGIPYEAFPAEAAKAGVALDVLREVLAGPQPDYSFHGGQWWQTGGGQPPVAVTEAPAPKREVRSVEGVGLVEVPPTGDPRVIMPEQGEEEVIFGPDGRPIVVRGGTGVGTRFTEAQSKDVVYATRARSALERLEGMGQAGSEALTSYGQAATEYIPFIGRSFQSDDYQVARQAGQEFLASILRKDTGAAVTNEEYRIYGSIFLPQPGDGPAVLEAKRQAREQAIRAIEAGMGADQLAAQARGLIEGAQAAPAASGGFTPAPQQGQAAPETPTVDATSIPSMSAADIEALISQAEASGVTIPPFLAQKLEERLIQLGAQ